jgi:hypothetical protein
MTKITALSDFLVVMKTNWKLPAELSRKAKTYNLKSWSARKLHQHLGVKNTDEIHLDGMVYKVLIGNKHQALWNEVLASQGKSLNEEFWISFRRVEYDGTFYAFALIQLNPAHVKKGTK